MTKDVSRLLELPDNTQLPRNLLKPGGAATLLELVFLKVSHYFYCHSGHLVHSVFSVYNIKICIIHMLMNKRHRVYYRWETLGINGES